MKNICPSSLLALTLAFPLCSEAFTPQVIYGEDGRQDVFEVTDSALVELSRSTAAMMSTKVMAATEGGFRIKGRTMAESGVCTSERFVNQVTGAVCSGFLVAENILVTAGHCISEISDCESYKWVFDFKATHAQDQDIVVPRENVYGCKRILANKYDPYSPTKDDYAMIELDRKVQDRAPLSFRREGTGAVNDQLVVIGHPKGLPTKIAKGAQVRRLESTYFVANLDTYKGNSGSAVFNAQTLEVEGILVRGETDFVYDDSKGCLVSKQCTDEGCKGEDVTYITSIPGITEI